MRAGYTTSTVTAGTNTYGFSMPAWCSATCGAGFAVYLGSIDRLCIHNDTCTSVSFLQNERRRYALLLLA